MRIVLPVANLSHPAKPLCLALIAFAAMALTACDSSRPAETATATPAATAPTAANGAAGGVNTSAGTRARADDRKVDGP